MNTLLARLGNTAKLGLFPALAWAVSCWGCGGDPQRTIVDDKNPGAIEILTRLGVREVTDPPAATHTSALSTGVTVDPATWQPLKSPSAVFSPRAEVLQIGAFVDGRWNTLIQDEPSAYKHSTPIEDDQSWEKSTAKTSVSADVDGDGLAEVVIFYVKPSDKATLNYRVFKNGKVTTEKAINGVVLSGKSFEHFAESGRSGVGTAWFPYLSSSRADINGDGRSEILLVDYKEVHVLSVQRDNTLTRLESNLYDAEVSSVAAGDLDGDHKDEFVVGLHGSGAQYAIYDSTFELPVANPEIQTLDQLGTFVEATFGDFNGNRLQQLALSTHLVGGPNAGQVQVKLLDFTAPPESAINVTSTLLVNDNYLGDVNYGSEDYFRMLPRAVNLTGLEKQQLHVMGWIYSDPMNKPDHTEIWSQFAFNWQDFGWWIFPDRKIVDYTVVDVQVGDADNDGKQDLYYLSTNRDGKPMLQVFSENGIDKVVLKKSLIPSPTQTGSTAFAETTTIAVGNFEDNAARVHYVGHKLTFTDPIVIAALASPPYSSDVAASDSAYQGAYSNWLTTFGTVSSNSTGSSHSVGFSIGASVEYEHKVNVPIFGFTIGTFKASAEFKNTNTWEWESTREVQKSIQYSCSGGQDCVIFTSVPMDEYRYEIDYSNVPENKVGDSLFISIPRPFNTYMVTRDFFNANIGEGVVPPVDSSVFMHTVGVPTSYPSASQKSTLMNQYFGNNAAAVIDYQLGSVPVSQGSNNTENSGTTNLQISVTDGNSKTITHDFSLDTSIGAGVGDVTVSLLAGFNTSYSATSSTSTGTQFGGTIGYLPTAFYSNPNYSYESGVFVYPHQATNGKSFWVVNYWVD